MVSPRWAWVAAVAGMVAGAGSARAQDGGLLPAPTPCTGAADHVVINEINYNSPVTLDSGDWVELYNPQDAAVDLTGWKFTDSATAFAIPDGTSLPAHGYLVLARDGVRFRGSHPDVSNVVGDWGFGLAATGEQTWLLAASGCGADGVLFGGVAPWPVEPNGTGPTLSLIDAASDNALPGSWAASLGLGGTPGHLNDVSPNTPPLVAITAPAEGATVASGTELSVTVSATDDGLVAGVEVQDQGTRVCTLSAAPFQCTWSPADGTHVLTAVATDDRGASTTSTAVHLTVEGGGGGGGGGGKGGGSCLCQATPNGPALGMVLLGLLAVRWRRRA